MDGLAVMIWICDSSVATGSVKNLGGVLMLEETSFWVGVVLLLLMGLELEEIQLVDFGMPSEEFLDPPFARLEFPGVRKDFGLVPDGLSAYGSPLLQLSFQPENELLLHFGECEFPSPAYLFGFPVFVRKSSRTLLHSMLLCIEHQLLFFGVGNWVILTFYFLLLISSPAKRTAKLDARFFKGKITENITI